MAESESPAVFLDRDGVINRRRPDHVRSWAEFEFLPGALEALAAFRAMKTRVVVITNQSAVGRGLLDREELGRIHARMMQAVRTAGGHVVAIYACLHAPEQSCACRKPAPTLFQRASVDLGIQLTASMMVGDSPTDVQAARAAGCRPVLVGSGALAVDPDVIAVNDLQEAVVVWRDLFLLAGTASC